MNSLNSTVLTVRRIVGVLLIAASITAAAFAQRVEPSAQGRMYGEPGFRGEPINLNVVNADIRDILSYITDQYGINFVIDKSVGSVPVTVKVNDVPWNIALESVLQSQELGVQVNGNILRIADNKILAAEGELVRERNNNALDTSPLETQLIRLNYANANGGATTGGTVAGTNPTESGPSAGVGGAPGSGGDGLLPIIKRRL